MLSTLPVRFSIPVSDPERAHQFYAGTLGLRFVEEAAGGQVFECSGTLFVLVKSASAGKVINSLLTWVTPDIDAEVESLRQRGVVFEDYDFPGVKSLNGIAELGADRVAWFKDSEGNILALAQLG